MCIRRDLIQINKTINSLDEIKLENDTVNLSVERISTRSHSLSIKIETFKSKDRNKFCKQVSTRHIFSITD